jgi:hypothetical protein
VTGALRATEQLKLLPYRFQAVHQRYTAVRIQDCHSFRFVFEGVRVYSGHKITASFGNVTVRGEKDGKGKGEARWRRVCLSMRSITENIF